LCTEKDTFQTVSKGMVDLANIIAGALVFGQLPASPDDEN
jgi:hypothetical protein